MAQSCRTVRAFGFFPAGTRSILVAIRKFLLLPGLIRASVRLRRRGARGRKQFWSGVQRTGPGGDVLWDVAERTELDRCLQRTGRHFDPALPVVDLGCGNGRFTRLLAGRFPVVVGIDVAASAVRPAEAESAGQPGVSYRVVDGADPAAMRSLAGEIGPVNVFVRGVLHVTATGRSPASSPSCGMTPSVTATPAAGPNADRPATPTSRAPCPRCLLDLRTQHPDHRDEQR